VAAPTAGPVFDVRCRDRILVTSEQGHSTIFKAVDRFEVLAENDLDEPS
jgi:hypothetical protein